MLRCAQLGVSGGHGDGGTRGECSPVLETGLGRIIPSEQYKLSGRVVINGAMLTEVKRIFYLLNRQ